MEIMLVLFCLPPNWRDREGSRDVCASSAFGTSSCSGRHLSRGPRVGASIHVPVLLVSISG